MWQNSIFPSFLAGSLMVLETNLVGGKAMWLDMFNRWLLGDLIIFYLPNWERGGGSTYPYAQLTPPSPTRLIVNKKAQFDLHTFVGIAYICCYKCLPALPPTPEIVAKVRMNKLRNYTRAKCMF